MVSKVFLTVGVAEFLFLLSGALILGFSLVTQNQINSTSQDGRDALRKLIAAELPLTAGIADGVCILVAFVLTLPGMFLPARGWLKLSSAVVVATSLFTLILGIYTWVQTLRFKINFNETYISQSPDVHSLIQTSFECCGYQHSMSPAFVTNAACPSKAAAALARGCSGPISTFANTYLDLVFTAMFAFVGMCTNQPPTTQCLTC
jgi:hypothetical protein